MRATEPDPAAADRAAKDESAHQDDVQSKRQFRIEGRVTDQAGQPVAALIEWGFYADPPEKRQRTTTDPEGNYRLEVHDYGVDYRLGVSAPGMAPQWLIPRASWHGSLRDIPRDEEVRPPTTANFELKPQHRLTGIVVDKDGQPITGATIRAETAVTGFHSSFSSPAPAMPIPGLGSLVATTGADGRFSIDHLPAGEVQLTINSPHRHVNARNYPVDREARIKMSGSGRPGVVRAKVVDRETGQPVQNYTLLRRYNPQPRFITSPMGRFEVDSTEGGKNYVGIYSKNHAPAVTSIVATPLDGDQETTIELESGQPLLGKLVDARTSEPLAAVPVLYGVMGDKYNYMIWPELNKYIDGHHPLTTVQHATTDAEGNFWFSEGALSNNGTLFAIAPGHRRLILRPEDRPAPSEDGRVHIKLAPEVAISGVLLNQGKPAADVEVSIWKQVAAPTKFDETFETVRTDANGAFRIGSLAPGTYGVSYVTRPSRRIRKPLPIATVELTSSEKRLEAFEIDVTLLGNGRE